MNKNNFLCPDWPAPTNIACLVTSCKGGDFNLALHVGDVEATVLLNRKKLQQEIALTSSIQWLNQVHGSKVFSLNAEYESSVPTADAVFTKESNKACGILTADCLPVLFCDQGGKEVAVAHAGWRGLVNGVLENTIGCFSAQPEALMVWLGPAIGPCHFEVGAEVREAFINAADSAMQETIAAAFIPSVNQMKWMADLYQLARLRLSAAGVNQVYGGGLCTYCEDKQFYSFRRNKNTGRFASVIWRKE